MASIPPSWQLALNTLAGKRGRTALIVGAVAIAAALIVAVSCAIASVQHSMEYGLVRILGAADARVIHQFGGRFDADILDEVRSWPEVERATGRLSGAVTLIHADGRIDPETNRPVRLTPSAVGVDFEQERHFSHREIIEGRTPLDPHEIIIDPITADELQAEVGDVLHVQRFGDPIELEVVGIYERERLVAAFQRPQIRIDRRTLAEAIGHENRLTSIAIIVADGVYVEAFCEKYAEDLPEALALEPAEMVRSGFDRRIEASQFGVLIGAILTFMSAAFIIVTAMTTAVTERQREMAMMRSIGATRGQLFSGQLIAGGILGAIGAVIGLPLGIFLTWLLVLSFQEFLPAGLAFSMQGLSLAMIGSISAGIAAAVYPAYLASSVSPLEAMTRPARPVPWRGIVVAALIGLALIGVQLLLLLPGDRDVRFYSYAYAGLPAVHIGYFLLAIPILLGVTWCCAAALSRAMNVPEGMLARSVFATPFRHGFTAGALMVGISLLISTWSGGQALLDDWLRKIEFADGFAYHPTGIRPDQQQAIANLPFVEAHCPIGYLPVRVIGEQVFGIEGISPGNVIGIGFDPEVFFEINAVDWLQGDPETAIPRLVEGDAIIVAERFLIARDIGVGDTLTLGAGRVEREFEIVGVVTSAGLDVAIQVFGVRSAYMEYAMSAVFMDFEALAREFDNRDAYIMQLNIAGDITDEEVAAAIDDVAPGVRFRSGRWIMEMIESIALTLLQVQSTIAFCALFLACIGMGNVLVANLHSRRFEYGVLRAVGAHRGVVVRLILGEATLLALAGALTGTILGMHLAWVGTIFYRDLVGLTVQVTLPTVVTAIGWGILLMMTMLVAAPAAVRLIRHEPAVLLSAGRNN